MKITTVISKLEALQQDGGVATARKDPELTPADADVMAQGGTPTVPGTGEKNRRAVVMELQDAATAYLGRPVDLEHEIPTVIADLKKKAEPGLTWLKSQHNSADWTAELIAAAVGLGKIDQADVPRVLRTAYVDALISGSFNGAANIATRFASSFVINIDDARAAARLAVAEHGGKTQLADERVGKTTLSAILMLRKDGVLDDDVYAKTLKAAYMNVYANLSGPPTKSIPMRAEALAAFADYEKVFSLTDADQLYLRRCVETVADWRHISSAADLDAAFAFIKDTREAGDPSLRDTVFAPGLERCFALGSRELLAALNRHAKVLLKNPDDLLYELDRGHFADRAKKTLKARLEPCSPPLGEDEHTLAVIVLLRECEAMGVEDAIYCLSRYHEEMQHRAERGILNARSPEHFGQALTYREEIAAECRAAAEQAAIFWSKVVTPSKRVRIDNTDIAPLILKSDYNFEKVGPFERMLVELVNYLPPQTTAEGVAHDFTRFLAAIDRGRAWTTRDGSKNVYDELAAAIPESHMLMYAKAVARNLSSAIGAPLTVECAPDNRISVYLA